VSTSNHVHRYGDGSTLSSTAVAATSISEKKMRKDGMENKEEEGEGGEVA